MTQPRTVEDVIALVRECPPDVRILAVGAGTKPALSGNHKPQIPNAQLPITIFHSPISRLHLSSLSGILEYEPSEFTFTALAGTRLSEVNALLDDHRQYLPFDPPLAERGATLGGTIAAGLSGPGRYRYGGARDFLIGVRFVDGEGRLVRGGGKVVKNAAGFDLPKLMVGSLGSLGLLVEMSFKVFPKPETNATVRLPCETLADALQIVTRLYSSQLDLDALDFIPEAETGPVALFVRLGGLVQAMPARLDRLRGLLGGGEALQGADEAALWRQAREFEWVPAGWTLIKVPLTPGRIPALEGALGGWQTLRRYGGGGQVLWLASPEAPSAFDGLLREQGLAGLAILGPAGQARLGARSGEAFARRTKQALDPAGRFVEA